MFSLIGLLFLAALGWAIVQGGRHLFPRNDRQQLGGGFSGRRPDGRELPGSGLERSETTEVLTRTGDERAGRPSASFTQQLSPLAQREEKINQLRRRYVNDEITVEQYEAELDKLMRE
ncbi:MAG: hypothetical protein ACRENP_19460 [Longimicrobiales bacterium]